jgi:glycosyltransferase involved in cell wall biosynthesis
MRVVHVLNSFHPAIGGAERQAAALAREQAARGFEVTIVTRRRPGLPAAERLGPLAIQRVGLGTLGFVAAGLAFLWPKRRSIDVVHAHQARAPALLGLLLRAGGGPPFVVKLAGGDVPARRGGETSGLGPRSSLRLAVLHRADAVVALTGGMRTAITGLGIPPDRVHVIPNGVDGDRFRPVDDAGRRRARAALGLPPEGLVVAFAGRLERVKGADLLLQAWSELDHRGAWLALGGGGPERKQLEALAGANPTIRFLGPMADTAPLYAAADLAVVPSRSEGLSNTLLEAMASGLAVVATAVGGNSEVVEDGRTGRLVAPDPPALAAALASLMNAPTIRARLGQAAASAVRARYDLKTTASAYEALYRRLAAADGGSSSRRSASAAANPSTAASMRA